MRDRQGFLRGRDFQQFYVAGRIVAEGDTERLYDQNHFKAVQRTVMEFGEKDFPYLSLYPPTMALLFSLPARLPYEVAILLWWLIQVGLFVWFGDQLVQDAQPTRGWRPTAGLAVTAFFPVILTVLLGQLAPLLLVVWLAGFKLHRRHRWFQEGCLLSLLALKPQFTLGVVVWLLIRRDVRTGAGLCLGLLLQAGLVALTLGPQVLVDYTENARLYMELSETIGYSPADQHGLAGSLKNPFRGGYGDLSNLVHLAVAGYAGILLSRIVRSQRRSVELRNVHEEDYPRDCRLEHSAVVLFSLLVIPHLLTYDLSLLLISVRSLWLAHMGIGDRDELAVGILLYSFATLSPLYVFTGISLMPFVLLWGLYALKNIANRVQPTKEPSDAD